MKMKNVLGIILLVGLIIVAGCFSFPTRVKDPTFSPVGGSYQSSVTVTISTTTSVAQIRYTTDGSTPTESSALYSSPLTFTQSTTLKAMAFKSGLLPSNAVTATYTITQPTPTAATPTFSPDGGTHQGSVNVIMATTTPGGQIRYTTNGAEPTSTSTLYAGPVSLTSTTTLKAKTFATGYTQSATKTATYTITAPPVTTGVTRSLSASSVPRNGQITVTLTKNMPPGARAFILEETIQGMTLSNIQGSGCGAISNNILRIVQIDELGYPPTSGTCTYTLTAPSTAGTRTFTGEYSIDGSDPVNIAGAQTVIVT